MIRELDLGMFLDIIIILRPEVLKRCFPGWQSLHYLSGLQLFFKFNFPYQQPVGVSFFTCAPFFFDAGLTLRRTLL